MKRLLIFSITAILVLALASCGKEPQREPVTLFPPVSGETKQSEETNPQIKVNDTYDNVLFEWTEQANEKAVEVYDNSTDYRTPDSYKYEEKATEYCVKAFRESTAKYSDVTIIGINVFDCVDDGESVYYSFNVRHSYRVESGGIINNSFFYDVGIKKDGETGFDASPYMYDVLKGYTVFSENNTESDILELRGEADEEAFTEAARTFAARRLKNPETAQIFSITDVSEENGSLEYEVVCSAENSYGILIKDSIRIRMEFSQETGTIKDITEFSI